VSIINQIYADKKYLLACKKIAGQNGDDLLQHVSLMLLEKENKGTLTYDSTKNLYTYFYRIARNEYVNKKNSFHKLYVSTTFTTATPLEEEDTIEPNPLDSLDTYARTPSTTKGEKFIKEVYLEYTKPNFKGVTTLSYQTGINKMTIYAALQRFKKSYDNYINNTTTV